MYDIVSFMKKFTIFCGFLIFYGFSPPAKAQSNDISNSQDKKSSQEEKNEQLAKFFKRHQAAGIALKFRSWPNPTEIKIIMEYTKENGLKKSKEEPFYPGWIFEWIKPPELPKNPKTLDDVLSSLPGFIAGDICSKLPKLKSVKDCIPDFLLFPPPPPGEVILGPNAYK